MIVGIAAALVSALYLLAVPVELALKIRTFPKPALGAGIALFEGRFALRRAEKRMEGEKKHLPWRKIALDSEKISSLRALKYAFRHLKIEKLTLTGEIGASDAAATALICGCGEAVKHALAPLPWGERTEIALRPDFSGGGIRLQLSGMVSIRAGHIISTALIGAMHYAKGRISQWKSTRLKTS